MNHEVHEGHEEDSVIETAVGQCRSTGRRKAARVRPAMQAGSRTAFVTFVFFVVIRFAQRCSMGE
jgi:hypothetical protein